MAIPNTWIVGEDAGKDPSSTSKNYDYQDHVFLLVNAAPEVSAGPRTGSAALNLRVRCGRSGTVADKDGEGTGFTGVQANTAGTQYQPDAASTSTPRRRAPPHQQRRHLEQPAPTPSRTPSSRASTPPGPRWQASTRVVGPAHQPDRRRPSTRPWSSGLTRTTTSRWRSALDICAAPGGKTLQLAAAGAAVTALDASDARLRRLRENLGRTGLAAEIIAADALAWEPGRRFDAVLVDAPCSATGTIRRHPDLPYLRTGREFGPLVALQGSLLRRSWGLVAPGGRLVYCVCSLLPAEGEEQMGGSSPTSPMPGSWRRMAAGA